MKWLLWKDYRHNRLIVFAALALLLGPYLIGFGVFCVGLGFGVFCGEHWIKTDMQNGQAVYWTPPWKEFVAGASMYSLVISQLSIALIGGNAIAGERVDRSSTFLYSLPIRRKKLLASKLILALAIAAIPWLLNVAVLGCLFGSFEMPPHRYQETFNLAATIATTGLVFFCVAWFLSSFVPSPAFNVCGGLITPFLLLSGGVFVHWLLILEGWSERGLVDTGLLWYLGTGLTIALVCFAIGTRHYLRRVEP